MNMSDIRIVQEEPPADSELSKWLGEQAYVYWSQIAHFIEQHYPGVFKPQWLFGGKKHGWYLRYKKTKSFCSFIPEKNKCTLLIVFGAREREQVESVHETLSPSTQKVYDQAKTYHDGKWVYMYVDNKDVLSDITKLLIIKRKPKRI